ncbi:carbohydrate-binding domain-containing protein [Zhouia sp. PK063]|uniref:carbohydrate-binding domain-containing protein n=1 Tax=Zhouia sp. PK063 TaxID=3373602 RepID=UPI0037AD7BB9
MKILSFKNLLCLCTIISFISCSNDDHFSTTTPSDGNGSNDSGTTVDNSEAEAIVASYQLTTSDAMEDHAASHEENDDYTWDDTNYTLITLNTTSIEVEGDGATVSGTTVTITNSGNYKITGTLTDGLIKVSTDDTDAVKIYLDGVHVTNSSNAPFFAKEAEKVVVFLAEGTTNYFTDTDSYVFEDDDDEPNACFFSKTDLTITGAGTLNVTGNYNDGVASKDGLIITNSATVNVTSADDGIRGKDYLLIKDATVDITSSGDGLKSDNDDDDTHGYIYIENATVDITSANDGIQAASDVLIASGSVNITSGGGSSVNLSEDADSAKAIKSDANIIVDSGDITISAADDAFNANDTLIVNGGTFTIATGDDALHADNVTAIYNGTITITKCYEGIEGSVIVIDGGSINLTSSDDGINAAGDDNEGNTIYLTGGYVVVNASGDGLDANGSIVMIGGTVIVNGPTQNNNGAIDYDNSFTVNGGTFMAAGSSGMAQTASSGSAQYAILIKFNGNKQAGSLVNIADAEGTNILTFAPAKSYQSLAFSSADLEEGETYTISVGGSASGTETDGVYTNATYTGGTTYATFTVNNKVTTIN